MRKEWLRRIEFLEQLELEERVALPKFVVVTDAIPHDRQMALAPGERIVADWYSDVDGFVMARERITIDPADRGSRCEPVVTWSTSINWIG